MMSASDWFDKHLRRDKTNSQPSTSSKNTSKTVSTGYNSWQEPAHS